MVELFDWLVQPCLDYVRLHCKTLLSCSPSHLVVMLIRLYECLVDKIITSSYQTDIELITNSQVSLSLCLSLCFFAVSLFLRLSGLVGNLVISLSVCLDV